MFAVCAVWYVAGAPHPACGPTRLTAGDVIQLAIVEDEVLKHAHPLVRLAALRVKALRRANRWAAFLVRASEPKQGMAVCATAAEHGGGGRGDRSGLQHGPSMAQHLLPRLQFAPVGRRRLRGSWLRLLLWRPVVQQVAACRLGGLERRPGDRRRLRRAAGDMARELVHREAARTATVRWRAGGPAGCHAGPFGLHRLLFFVGLLLWEAGTACSPGTPQSAVPPARRPRSLLERPTSGRAACLGCACPFRTPQRLLGGAGAEQAGAGVGAGWLGQALACPSPYFTVDYWQRV